ncbi:hypothetical protein Dvina_31750 [Dactylosporangium vinaceum]|uniref:Secreted protein n=1 Tax=Dactylosporangium vinaceum TaxID=53362 RepID=A0ABV5MBA6_9ACTN|nr:hypothetical protein [Dactylosporangium vinaceum]UAB92874.1 hypothetical protein Dvina_31750 [Dactylosporangium vinaceum]
MKDAPDLLHEDDVRALLHGVPAPQAGVDLEAAMRAGRRMSLRRGAAGVAGGTAAVVLAAALAVVVSRADAAQKPATAPAAVPSRSAASTPASSPAVSSVTDIKLRCPMTPLNKPAGAGGLQVDAVDPSGRYVSGHAVDDRANFTSVLWVDGAPQYLRFAASVQIKSINSHGVAAGEGGDADPNSAEWYFRYAGGEVTRLQVPAGWRQFGNVTINEHGDIADTIKPEDDRPEGAVKGVVWKAGSTTPILVPLPSRGTVIAITADTRLLGYIGDGAMQDVYLWDLAGTATKLPHPAGSAVAPAAAAGSYASGWIPGLIPRWDITTNQLTTIPAVPDGDNRMLGMHVSATGWITDGVQVAYRPDGTAVRLSAPGTSEVGSAGVTDNGDVFGTYYDRSRKHESYTAAVWHCGSAA